MESKKNLSQKAVAIESGNSRTKECSACYIYDFMTQRTIQLDQRIAYYDKLIIEQENLLFRSIKEVTNTQLN